MSERGTILDAFVTLVDGAVSGITTERGLRQGESLRDSEYPYAFVWRAADEVEFFPYNSVREVMTFRIDLWTIADTQEQIELKRDLVKQAIGGDPTVGGVVDDARYISGVTMERPDKGLKVCTIEVETVVRRRTVVSFEIACDVALKNGRTAAQFTTALAALVVTTTSGESGARTTSDYLPDQAIPSGEVRFQIRALPVGTLITGAFSYSVLAVRLHVHRRLGAAEAERSYTEDELQTYVAAMQAPSYWKVAADVYQIVENPTLDFPADLSVGGVGGGES